MVKSYKVTPRAGEMGHTLWNKFCDHIPLESLAWHVYRYGAVYFGELGLNGFKAWCRKQATEEDTHGRVFEDMMLVRDAVPEWRAHKDPQFEFSSPLEFLKYAYEREQDVSRSIAGLLREAEEGANEDPVVARYLEKMLEEQGAEEGQLLNLLRQLRRADKDWSAILEINSALAAELGVAARDAGDPLALLAQ